MGWDARFPGAPASMPLGLFGRSLSLASRQVVAWSDGVGCFGAAFLDTEPAVAVIEAGLRALPVFDVVLVSSSVSDAVSRGVFV